MNVPFSFHCLLGWMLFSLRLVAYDPTLVDGKVTVEVDRSEAVWKVVVSNQSKQLIRYEMMGKVPRGLDLEIWNDNLEQGFRVHAEDLADALGIDGFSADLRELPAGESVEFQLNPKSMSTATGLAEGRWKQISEWGHYDCRVSFGGYASRMMNVSPKRKLRTPSEESEEEPAPEWLEDKAEKPIGIRLRQELNEKGLALVDWHRGSDRGDDYYVTYWICKKADFDRMPVWDSSKAIKPGMPEVVAKAHELARKKLGDCEFGGLMMDRCSDERDKFSFSCWFANDDDDVSIKLLLNGAPTKKTKLVLTEAQNEELSEYGIPMDTR